MKTEAQFDLLIALIVDNISFHHYPSIQRIIHLAQQFMNCNRAMKTATNELQRNLSNLETSSY